MNARELRALVQGSPEWAAARIGYATSSNFSSILAKGQGKMRATYMRRVLAERLTGKPCDTYHNDHMDRGHAQEPYARLAYEAKTGNLVENVGIIRHASLMASASPDGLLDAKGGVEIKSVIPTVQVETILSGGYPPEHRAQVQGNLWLCGYEFWDFCSYCPDMPEHLRLYIFRVTPDEEYIKTLEREVRGFLAEVQTRYDVLMGNDLKVMAA